MRHTYSIQGMTCGGCKKSVEKHLSELKNVTNVSVHLEKNEVDISTTQHIAIEVFQKALPNKYLISQKKETESSSFSDPFVEKTSKLQQLKPLFLIFFYITTSSVLINFKDWNWHEFMLDFMGLFFIVFSFFKMLDLKGFPTSFKMYDPLAKKIPIYAYLYPFIETTLGIMFLVQFEVKIALWTTLIILGITTIGVLKTLVDKKSIQCACLGTVLQLPMTQATFIENAIMITMAILMIIGVV